MIKSFVYNSVFIKYNISQLLFIINDCLAYFIIIVIDLIRFRHFIIIKIINNINIEFDIIEIQSIRCENDLMLLFQLFIFKIDKLVFNYMNKNINFKVL